MPGSDLPSELILTPSPTKTLFVNMVTLARGAWSLGIPHHLGGRGPTMVKSSLRRVVCVPQEQEVVEGEGRAGSQ